jgi:hypothetical protein
MLRFSLRSLLALVTLCAIAAALGVLGLDPVTYIATRADWDAAIKHNRCVVFVDGDWNGDMVLFRRPYTKFAEWCQDQPDIAALAMKIDPNDETDDVWKICDELWTTNRISRGGLKNYHGAGRVVWIDHGKVVDHAWCMELVDEHEIDNIDRLIARTRNAFNPSQ